MHQYNKKDSSIYQTILLLKHFNAQKMPNRVNKDANESLNQSSDEINSLIRDILNRFPKMNRYNIYNNKINPKSKTCKKKKT